MLKMPCMSGDRRVTIKRKKLNLSETKKRLANLEKEIETLESRVQAQDEDEEGEPDVLLDLYLGKKHEINPVYFVN